MKPVFSLIVALSITALGAAFGAGPAMAFDCGSDPWRMGGADFSVAATGIGSKDCGRCEVAGPDGFKYVVQYEKGVPQVLVKTRDLVAGEKLPFAINAGDTPEQTLAKALAARASAGLGRTMKPKPVSVALTCDATGPGSFMLQVLFDQDGKMTGVSETWLGGRYVYVDDFTFHVEMKSPNEH